MIWVHWLTKTPHIETHNQKPERKITTAESKPKTQSLKTKNYVKTAAVYNNKSKIYIKNELPKLVNLATQEELDKRVSFEDDDFFESLSSTSLNIKELADTAGLPQVKLRDKKAVDKSRQKQILKIIAQAANIGIAETETSKNWVPKYLEGKKELSSNIGNVQNNLDQIAGQLELIALIPGLNNTGTAIIRNKISNKIELLKKGEEFEGLQLLEITANQITLGNQSLNKKYIKKLETNVQ